MNYRWLVILALSMVTACNSSTKENAKNKAEPGKTENRNPADELNSEFEIVYGDFVEKIKNAKPSDRAEIRKSDPKNSFAEKFIKLANENSDSEIEATALAWLASNSIDADDRSSALESFLKDYSDSPAMKVATGAILATGKPSQSAEETLRSVMDNSPHREARGAAAYHLVSYLVRYKTLTEDVDELAENKSAVDHIGEEGIDYLRNLRVNDLEIEKLYETVANDYADVEIFYLGRNVKIGDAVKNAWFEIKFLSMGCIAPDIEGSDLDGKEFALSDYRGKVVMLDFWGDW